MAVFETIEIPLKIMGAESVAFLVTTGQEVENLTQKTNSLAASEARLRIELQQTTRDLLAARKAYILAEGGSESFRQETLANIVALEAQQVALKNQVNHLGLSGRAANQTKNFYKGANSVFLESGRIANDLAVLGYGNLTHALIGVSNNMEGLLLSTKRVIAQENGVKGAVKAMAKSFFGFGGVLFLVQAAATGLVIFGDDLAEFFNKTGFEAKKAGDAYREALEELIKFDLHVDSVTLDTVDQARAQTAHWNDELDEAEEALGRARISQDRYTGSGAFVVQFTRELVGLNAELRQSVKTARAEVGRGEAALKTYSDQVEIATEVTQRLGITTDELNEHMGDLADIDMERMFLGLERVGATPLEILGIKLGILRNEMQFLARDSEEFREMEVEENQLLLQIERERLSVARKQERLDQTASDKRQKELKRLLDSFDELESALSIESLENETDRALSSITLQWIERLDIIEEALEAELIMREDANAVALMSDQLLARERVEVLRNAAARIASEGRSIIERENELNLMRLALTTENGEAVFNMRLKHVVQERQLLDDMLIEFAQGNDELLAILRAQSAEHLEELSQDAIEIGLELDAFRQERRQDEAEAEAEHILRLAEINDRRLELMGIGEEEVLRRRLERLNEELELAETTAERRRELIEEIQETELDAAEAATSAIEATYDRRVDAVERWADRTFELLDAILDNERRYTATDIALTHLRFDERREELEARLRDGESVNLELNKLAQDRAQFEQDVERDKNQVILALSREFLSIARDLGSELLKSFVERAVREVGIHVAAETAKTTATVVGVNIRKGAKTSEIATNLVVAGSTMVETGAEASKAAAASVPFPFNLAAIAFAIAAVVGMFASMKSAFGFASGGYVGRQGASGRDSIPAMLGSGEAVLNRHQQQYVEVALASRYGFGLDELFKREGTPHYLSTPKRHTLTTPPKFASGGFATSRPDEGMLNALGGIRFDLQILDASMAKAMNRPAVLISPDRTWRDGGKAGTRYAASTNPRRRRTG